MQLRIAQKLILLALIPIVTLLIFSINHLDDKYTQMKLHSKQLVYAEFIKLASSVLYVLQIERGLSTSYISNNSLVQNSEKLQEQYERSAIVFRKSTAYLQTLDLSVLTKLQLVLIDGITSSIQTIGTIRERLLNKDITSDEVFYFYTNINNQILDLATSLNIHMEEELIQNKVFALYKLLELQEQAGQERALICTFDTSKPIPTFKLQKFYSLAIVQGDIQTSIFNFFYKSKNSLYFSEILNTNTYPYITEIRKKIENHKFDKNNNLEINLEIWFNQTSKKIFTLNGAYIGVSGHLCRLSSDSLR